MMRAALLFAWALVPTLPTMALAQTPVPPPVQQDLYQEALQSIAEGRKNDASEALTRQVAKEPQNAGAWLELALLQCGLGHADEAERLFAAIEQRFNPPQGILDVINEARDQGCQRWQAIHSSTLVVGRGIDQNVNQGALDPHYVVQSTGKEVELSADFKPKHDQYTVLSGEYLREVTPNGSMGFIQFQGRHNDSLTQYNSASLFTGIETPYRFGRWTLRTTGMLGLVSLGGRFYQRQAQLQARIGPPLPLPNSTQFTLMGGITHTQYLTLTNFDANTYELRGQFTYRRDGLFASAAAGYLVDHAREARPGGSRQGWFSNLLARKTLERGWIGEAAYTRQTWTSNASYLPGFVDQVRDQVTHVLRGTLTYPLNKNQSLQLEARMVRNRENISIFEYDNRQLQLSWQWQTP